MRTSTDQKGDVIPLDDEWRAGERAESGISSFNRVCWSGRMAVYNAPAFPAHVALVAGDLRHFNRPAAESSPCHNPVAISLMLEILEHDVWAL